MRAFGQVLIESSLTPNSRIALANSIRKDMDVEIRESIMASRVLSGMVERLEVDWKKKIPRRFSIVDSFVKQSESLGSSGEVLPGVGWRRSPLDKRADSPNLESSRPHNARFHRKPAANLS